MQSVNDKAKAKQAQLLMQLLIQGVKQLQFVLVSCYVAMFTVVHLFTDIYMYTTLWLLQCVAKGSLTF